MTATAQTTKKEIFADINRTGSNYFAYPGPTNKKLTKAPEGYTPFYISHYGRHGSRYMSSNEYYVIAINKLDSAAQFGILNAKGQEVLEKLHKGYVDAWHRSSLIQERRRSLLMAVN
jgi:O-glycosyl hydrolase